MADAPLLGRKKELADVLRLLGDGAEIVTVTGPPGIGKRRFAQAVLAEAPHADVRTAEEPLGLPGEHEYRLRPLAEAPAVELYRSLTGDEVTPYGELVARVPRVPGDIVALAARRTH